MTNKLMKPFVFPGLLPNNVFESFEQFFNGLDDYNPNTKVLSLRGFPKGDVFYDDKGNRVIELALAGYTKEQLSVVVEDGILTVSAEKCDKENCNEQRTLARRAFKQVFSNFGEDFSLEETEVTYKDGLLRIVVPKAEKPQVEQKTLTIK